MRKYFIILIIVLLVIMAASPVYAGDGLFFEDAGITMELPSGFHATEYTNDTRAQFTEQLEEYELSNIVKSAQGLPVGFVSTTGLPNVDDYVVIDDGGAYVAYIVAVEDDNSKALWSFSELDRGIIAETVASLQSGDAQVALHENDYVFISIQESGKVTGNYQIASFETIENGYNIMIVVSSLHGDSLAVGREIADSVVIAPKVSGSYVAGWVVAIIVSVILAVLFLRQRKATVKIRRTEYEKMQGYGWVVILVIVSLFINVALLVANLFGDYSIYESNTVVAVIVVNLSGLALRILLLFSIFKKSRFFVPLYIVTIIIVFIGNAAFKSYANMAFSIIDIIICVYLLYSKRIAAVFKFREIQIIEDVIDYAVEPGSEQ